ncbi:radical SAM protein [Geodermatophilus sabuli]|uniref:Intein C-terminal splicing region n=1 Tax=Geodermatophilus sabuli TaxID=1564158 RepID=A0A285EBE9_9ACTN|nr:radical SAM protein [Geodermatophilus sabuli]MBB3084278.1 DNA repair photolyase [Geodermatophilus sabuli]SNX96452.1 intein C-terminal splicing region [Geodermatophilus sabuli]
MTTDVLAHWSTVKPAHRVRLADGTELVASGGHRFLSARGWKHVTGAMTGRDRRPYLTTDDELLGLGRSAEAQVAWPTAPTSSWQRGLLAGIVDAEGSRSRHVLRISNADDEMSSWTQGAFDDLGLDAVPEERDLANGVRNVRLRGGLREHLRFIHLVDPAIRRTCTVEGTAVNSDADLRVVAIEDLGLEMPMYDITTGTGDFVANGVISHNCFARGTHEWLELDTGRDFDSQVVVKTNVVDVLHRELGRPSWRREHVALGTNTDPYQRAEGRYRLMPGVISALAGAGTPFSILTKGTLLRRDLPLLAAASRDVPIGLGVSMAILDGELHESLEPGVPSPRARLELVRAITDAGLSCGVFLAPVLPGLTDRLADLHATIAAIAEAGSGGVTVVPLHLRPGAREWFSAWLAREHPQLVPRYQQLYRRGASVAPEYRRWLAARVAPLLAEHGLDRRAGGSARGTMAAGATPTGIPGDDDADFPVGSLPAVPRAATAAAARARTARAAAPEQLTLL